MTPFWSLHTSLSLLWHLQKKKTFPYALSLICRPSDWPRGSVCRPLPPLLSTPPRPFCQACTEVTVYCQLLTLTNHSWGKTEEPLKRTSMFTQYTETDMCAIFQSAVYSVYCHCSTISTRKGPRKKGTYFYYLFHPFLLHFHLDQLTWVVLKQTRYVIYAMSLNIEYILRSYVNLFQCIFFPMLLCSYHCLGITWCYGSSILSYLLISCYKIQVP